MNILRIRRPTNEVQPHHGAHCIYIMMFQNNPRFFNANYKRLLIVYHDTQTIRYDLHHTYRTGYIIQNTHPHRPYDSPAHCLCPVLDYAK